MQQEPIFLSQQAATAYAVAEAAKATQLAQLAKLESAPMVVALRESEKQLLLEKLPHGTFLVDAGVVLEGDYTWNFHRQSWAPADARVIGALVGLCWGVARKTVQ